MFADALDCYELAITAPNQADLATTYYNYGVMLWQVQEFAAVKRAWLMALQLNPELVVARANYASMLCSAGDVTASERQYDMAIASVQTKLATLSANSSAYHSELGLFWGFTLQKVFSALPIMYTDDTHVRVSRSKYIAGLQRLASHAPLDAFSRHHRPEEFMGCGSLGYYVIYQGHSDSDAYNRKLHAHVYSKMARSYFTVPTSLPPPPPPIATAEVAGISAASSYAREMNAPHAYGESWRDEVAVKSSLEGIDGVLLRH